MKTESIIKLENVHKDYVMGESKIHAVEAINLDIKKGEFLALVGPSGSGKSTMMNLVGGIGIMNTMYTSVLERTKEIGTMKAVGAKNSDILLIFLFESGLLGLVGGAIGILLGVGIGKSVEYIATIYLGTDFLQASFGVPLIIGALLFSFVVGSFSGLLPAYQASKLKPVDALRYE